MQFPMTHPQAHILCRLINNEKLLKREMDPFDVIVLTQVGAIKRTNNENKNRGLTITKLGMRRFLKFAKKEGMVA